MDVLIGRNVDDSRWISASPARKSSVFFKINVIFLRNDFGMSACVMSYTWPYWWSNCNLRIRCGSSPTSERRRRWLCVDVSSWMARITRYALIPNDDRWSAWTEKDGWKIDEASACWEKTDLIDGAEKDTTMSGNREEWATTAFIQPLSCEYLKRRECQVNYATKDRQTSPSSRIRRVQLVRTSSNAVRPCTQTRRQLRIIVVRIESNLIWTFSRCILPHSQCWM